MKEKQIVYDNFPDMKIKLQDGCVVTLAELESLTMEHGKMFAYAPWSTSKNPRSTRIIASISADGSSLHDFKTGISHRWASRKPVTVDRSQLAKMLNNLIKELDT